MKALIAITSAALVILERTFLLPPVLIVFIPVVVFAIITTIRLHRRKLSYLNELPNILRIFIASLGASLIGFFSGLSIFLGFILILLGMFANDEAMRRLYRQKGVIVLTGIDATGKSTHARKISRWLQKKGFNCKVIPFHRYLFLNKMSSLKKKQNRLKTEIETRVPIAKTSKLSVIRPYIAVIDNILFYILIVFPEIIKRNYVVCDRFIWDNYIKHKALGYKTYFLSIPSMLIKPQIGIVFDLPAEVAFERVKRRKNHLQYSIKQYETERKEFKKIASLLNYPIIETTETIQQSWQKIEAYLNSFFTDTT